MIMVMGNVVPSFCGLELPEPSYRSFKMLSFLMKCIFALSFIIGLHVATEIQDAPLCLAPQIGSHM